MDFGKIIEIVFAVIVLGFLVYSTIKALIPLLKNKTFWENIMKYMIEAETSKKNGEDKLNYVINKATDYAKKNGIDISIATLKKVINKLVELTKNINV